MRACCLFGSGEALKSNEEIILLKHGFWNDFALVWNVQYFTCEKVRVVAIIGQCHFCKKGQNFVSGQTNCKKFQVQFF